MVTITFSDKSLNASNKQSMALFVAEDKLETKEFKALEKDYFPGLSKHCKQRDFLGQAGILLTIPVIAKNSTKTIILVGLGKQKKSKTIEVEVFRRAVGSLIKTMQAQKLDSCAALLPDAALFELSEQELAKEVAVIASMAAYRFEEYITEKNRFVNQSPVLELVVKPSEKKACVHSAKEGAIIAEAVNMVRHWINLPPVALTPTELAQKAKSIAKKYKLGITVFDEKQIQKMGMGGLAGVSAGSDQDCKFVILEYKAAKKAPTLALVGKGITFDSGGLSLKPPRYMETMKEDMSGAAAVIGAMQAIAQLAPKVNVVSFTPLSENLPSGKATKPGDILRFYNGMTAEVKNTDAEGRLILADALAYATKHFKPDAMIDIATLTGACAYALGPFFTGLMSQHTELAKRIKAAAVISGDRVWELPLDDDYKKAIKSPVADICNIGNETYMAGAITAGFFLQNFVGPTPWAHLDIAGTAFNVPDISYYSGGATGAGVRLLVALATNWQ